MNPPLNFARSLAALFIGFFALAGIDSILTALALKFFFGATAASPTSPQIMGLLALKVVSGLVGGYLAAALAGSHRWQHALILAGVVLSFGLLGLVAMKNAPRSAFTTYALVLSPLSIVIGGWLRQRRAA